MIIPSAVLSLFILFLVPNAGAQEAATLEGRIVDASNQQPLPGANVVLTVPGSERMIAGGASGADGSYRIANIEAGTYEVAARFVGYTTTIREITLSAGETRTLDFILSPGGFDLANVVVTASRQAEKVLDAPASISVLGVREIESDVAQASVDVLRNTVGVDMAQTGVNRREIVLRGFNNAFSGATYVLTDNRHAAVPSLGVNVYSLMPTMSIDLERIEVVRGPGSALYGPGVDAGVIHFISKDPFTHPGTTVSVSGGERAFFNGQLRHAGVINDRIGYKITGTYTRADDWELDPNDPQDRIQLDSDVRARNYDHQGYNFNGLLSYRFSDDVTLTASGGYSAITSIVLSGIGTLQGDGFGYTYGQLRLTAGDLFAQMYFNKNNAGDSFVYGTGMPVVDNGLLFNTQAQYNWSLSERQDFVFGADAQLTRPDTEGTILGRNEDEQISEYGAYVQSQSRLTEQLDLTLALRADYNNIVDVLRLSPRAAVVFKPTPSHSLRATYNRAFASPGTNSMFLDIVARAGDETLPLDIRARGSAFGFSYDRNPAFEAIAGTDLVARSLIPQMLGQPTPVGLALDLIYGMVYGGLASTPVAGIQAALAAQGINLPVEQVGALVSLLDPNLTQVSGFSRGSLAMLNPSTGQFVPVSGVTDISPLAQTLTQTVEVGYKGIIGDRVLLAIDGYYTHKENFVGPALMESPMVFVPQLNADLAGALGAGIQGNATLLAALQQMGLSPEMVAQLIVGFAQDSLPSASTPIAAVVPRENDLGPGQMPELMLAYRNFGSVGFYGADVSTQIMVSDRFDIFGNLSWVSDDLFDAEALGEENPDLFVALNAPKFKSRLGFQYRTTAGVSFGAAGRYSDGFPVNSGPYNGRVDNYFLMDLSAGYDFARYAPGLRFDVTVQNVFDEDHREFVGAPRLGRMGIARLTYTM